MTDPYQLFGLPADSDDEAIRAPLPGTGATVFTRTLSGEICGHSVGL